MNHFSVLECLTGITGITHVIAPMATLPSGMRNIRVIILPYLDTLPAVLLLRSVDPAGPSVDGPTQRW